MKQSVKTLIFTGLLLGLVACQSGKGGNSTGGGSGNIPSPINPVTDTQEHLVEGTIHDFDINYEEGVVFIDHGACDYYVASTKAPEVVKAARYIISQIFNAYKVVIPLVLLDDDEVVASNEKAIVIGSNASFEAAGLTRSGKDIGRTGYEMYTKGVACYIVGDGEQAFQLASIKFLEVVTGYDLLWGSTIVYEKDGSRLPKMAIVERPDFDFRQIDDQEKSLRYGAGFAEESIFMGIGNIQYHTSFQVLQPEVYGPAHPEWFTEQTIRQGITSATKGQNTGQLCYTAHGNETSLQLMKETAAQNIINAVERNYGLSNITFTIEDNYNICSCETCTQSKDHFNGSNAAAIVLFMNDVDDIVQDYLQKKADQEGTAKRELFISFFAYHATEVAPVEEVNGEYVAIDNIHTNENVAVFLAPISSAFTHSFYDDANKDVYEKVRRWSTLSEHLYLWMYDTNFQNYLYPYNTFGVMGETYRFLKENNCSMVYSEGQHDLKARSVYSRLKLYIESKIMINVNVNVNEIINKFFKYYYDKAGDTMKAFFEEMVQWGYYQEETWPAVFNGTIYNVVNNADYWNANTLSKWENACYKAIEEISYLEKSKPADYDMYRDNILIESIFPRWALLELFSNNFSSAELDARRRSFKQDADYFGFDRTREGDKGAIGPVYESWGLA